MAVIICEFCRDNGARTEVYEVLLWSEKAGVCGGSGDYYGGGYGDDVADNTILLWYGVANFGSRKSTDFADFAVCDGVGVYGWRGGGCAYFGDGGRVFGDKITGFSYCGGGIFWWDEKFFNRNRTVSGVGVFDLSGDFYTSCDWTYQAKNGKIKGRELLNKFKLEKICLDIVNGRRLSGKRRW